MRSRDRVRHVAAPVLAITLVLAACGGGAAGGDPADQGTTGENQPATITPLDPAVATTLPGEADGEPTVTDTNPPSAADQGTGETPADPAVIGGSHVAFAMADLADRMDTPLSDIVLVSQEEVMWRDGSLGCPQPGFSYTQALVDGYKVTLQIGSIEYAYHGRAGHDPFLCQNDLATDKDSGSISLEPKEEGSDDLNYDGSVDQ